MKLTGKRCQCCACGEPFNSASTFDRHRVGRLDRGEPRRCLLPAELLKRGWSRNARGFWIERERARQASTVGLGARIADGSDREAA